MTKTRKVRVAMEIRKRGDKVFNREEARALTLISVTHTPLEYKLNTMFKFGKQFTA